MKRKFEGQAHMQESKETGEATRSPCHVRHSKSRGMSPGPVHKLFRSRSIKRLNADRRESP